MPKQICITVPDDVVSDARKEAAKKRRADGLKLLPTAVLRAWLLKGREVAREQE